MTCPHCGASLTVGQLLALAAIASTSKAAGALALAKVAEGEARRKTNRQEEADALVQGR